MMFTFAEIEKILAEYQQSHILKYWDDLTEEEQRDFLYHLKSINFKDVHKIYEKTQTDMVKDMKLIDTNMRPIQPESEKDLDASVLEEYRKIGLEAVSDLAVAVVVLAGGQGTRLGEPFPKGLCETGLPSGKSLLQLQAEKIRKVCRLSKFQTELRSEIQMYIMTSDATNNVIDKYLRENKYFGLRPEQVILFKQGSLPCFDFDGKILLEERNAVALAPDGNGGLYRALLSNGILKDMASKEVQYVHVYSVDNMLVKVADPVFIGKCIKNSADCGLKVVRKLDATEPLGVVCKIDDKYQVVEYSEIAKDKAELQDENGDLVFNAGNMCEHFFTLDFLCKIAEEHEEELKLHTAKKVVTHVNTDGDKSRPYEPNAVKIEKFIFDVIPFAKNFVAWEVDRTEHFSPIKNSNIVGKACFNTARRDLLTLHKKYVENAGGLVKCEGVEISPLLSYDGENLQVHVGGKVYEKVVEILADTEMRRVIRMDKKWETTSDQRKAAESDKHVTPEKPWSDSDNSDLE